MPALIRSSKMAGPHTTCKVKQHPAQSVYIMSMPGTWQSPMLAMNNAIFEPWNVCSIQSGHNMFPRINVIDSHFTIAMIQIIILCKTPSFLNKAIASLNLAMEESKSSTAVENSEIPGATYWLKNIWPLQVCMELFECRSKKVKIFWSSESWHPQSKHEKIKNQLQPHRLFSSFN